MTIFIVLYVCGTQFACMAHATPFVNIVGFATQCVGIFGMSYEWYKTQKRIKDLEKGNDNE